MCACTISYPAIGHHSHNLPTSTSWKYLCSDSCCPTQLLLLSPVEYSFISDSLQQLCPFLIFCPRGVAWRDCSFSISWPTIIPAIRSFATGSFVPCSGFVCKLLDIGGTYLEAPSICVLHANNSISKALASEVIWEASHSQFFVHHLTESQFSTTSVLSRFHCDCDQLIIFNWASSVLSLNASA